MAKRFFINNVDTFLGQALVEQCLSEQEGQEDADPTIILGTLRSKKTKGKPKNVTKILLREKPRLFKKYILECDVLIYDLTDSNLEEVENVIRTLKSERLEREITFIAISSVLVWSATQIKFREKLPEEPDSDSDNQVKPQSSDEEDEQEDEEDEEEDENASEKLEQSLKEESKEVDQSKQASAEPSEILKEKSEIGEEEEDEETRQERQQKQEAKKEKKRLKRIPYTEEDLGERQTLEKYEGIKNIEQLLMSINSKENFYPYVVAAGFLYGKGENLLTYHFKSAWLESPPQLPYIGEGINILPTIHIKDLTQLIDKIINSKPEIKYVIGIDAAKKQTQKQVIEAISKGIGTGEIVQIPQEQASPEWAEALSTDLWFKPSSLLVPPGEEEQEEEEAGDFEWHCKRGIVQNIPVLESEFNKYRGLKPIKVYITGPPCSGKSYYGAKLARHYNVPHIRIEDIITLLKNDQGELGKKAKKIKEEFPEELIIDGFQQRLNENHCRNRGYILDGFPTNFKNAEKLFTKMVQSEEEEFQGEEEEQKVLVPAFYEEIFPASAISLTAQDLFLKKRVTGNEKDFKNQLKQYREDQKSELPSVEDYFKQKLIEVYQMEADQDEYEAFLNIRIYIERFGRPFNYLETEEQLQKERNLYIEENEEVSLQELNFHKNRLVSIDNEQRNQIEIQAKLRLEQIKARERELMESRSMPLRHYLMENIIPVLTEGLIEVCKVLPDDPVDYLSEFLFKNSVRPMDQEFQQYYTP